MADRPLQDVQSVIKIPCYDVNNRRSIGGVGGIFLEQKFINIWPEVQKNPITGEGRVVLQKRAPLRQLIALNPTIGSYGTLAKMFCMDTISMSQVSDVCVGAFFDINNSKIYILQYRPSAGTTVKIGELTGCTSTDFVFLTEIQQNTGGTYPAGTLTPGVAVSYMKGDRSVGAAYYATTTTGVFTAASLTTISSGSFPSNLGTPKVITGPIQQMNGVNYIMTMEGTIYASGGTNGNLFDITSWNTSGISIASQYPDGGVSVMRFKNMLLAFGTNSVEFFVDAALPPPSSPLERTEQAFIKFGAIGPKCIKNINDEIYWLAYGGEGVLGIWHLNGYTPEKISSPDIDDFISYNFNSFPAAINSFEASYIKGKLHLVCNGLGLRTAAYYANFTFGNETWPPSAGAGDAGFANNACYNITDKTWWGLSLGTTIGTNHTIKSAMNAYNTGGVPWNNYVFRVNSSVNASADDCTILQYWNNYGAYRDELIAIADNEPIIAVWQTNQLWFETARRKRINKLELIGEKWSQPSTDSATDYTTYIASLYDSPDLFKTADLTVITGTLRSIVGLPTTGRVVFTNMGTARQAGWIIIQKANCDFCIHGLDLYIQQNTN